MEKEIVLSICVSAYNRKEMTCRNIKKMLRYPGEDIEIIVSDNASEDGTYEALQQIEDGRLRIYRNEVNIGLGGNSLRLMAYARGKYVTIINERDWMDPVGIKSFVKRYRDSDCDFILASYETPEEFAKYKDSVEGHTFLGIYYCHPGSQIVRRCVYEELNALIGQMTLSDFTAERQGDLGARRMAAWIYAPKWDSHKQIIRMPLGRQLARIEQLRGTVSNDKIYFTPESRLYRFKLYLDNGYIRETDREAYFAGSYRCNVHCALTDFFYARKDPSLLARYHYVPDKSVCWIGVAVKFYLAALAALKEKKLCSVKLAAALGAITAEEYLSLIRVIARDRR